MEILILVLAVAPAIAILPGWRGMWLRMTGALCFLAAASLAILRAIMDFSGTRACMAPGIEGWPMLGSTLSMGCGPGGLWGTPVVLGMGAIAFNALLLFLPQERSGKGGGILSALVLSLLLLAGAEDVLQACAAFILAGHAFSLFMGYWRKAPVCRIPSMLSSLAFLLYAMAFMKVAGSSRMGPLTDVPPVLRIGHFEVQAGIPAVLFLFLSLAFHLISVMDVAVRGEGREALWGRILAAGMSVFVFSLVLVHAAPVFGAVSGGGALAVAMMGAGCFLSLLFLFYPGIVKKNVDLACQSSPLRRLRAHGAECAFRVARLDDEILASLLSRIEMGLAGLSPTLRRTVDYGRLSLAAVMGTLFLIGLAFWKWGGGGGL